MSLKPWREVIVPHPDVLNGVNLIEPGPFSPCDVPDDGALTRLRDCIRVALATRRLVIEPAAASPCA